MEGNATGWQSASFFYIFSFTFFTVDYLKKKKIKGMIDETKSTKIYYGKSVLRIQIFKDFKYLRLSIIVFFNNEIVL